MILGNIEVKSTKKLTPPELVNEAIKNNEGTLAKNGALVVYTGKYTGRSPNDRYIVDTREVHDKIAPGNKLMHENTFNRIYEKFKSYLRNKPVYVFNGYVGSGEYSIALRVITELASQSLFANHMFKSTEYVTPEYTVISCPGLKLSRLNSEAGIILNISKKIILIAATKYAGEIKKSIFTTLNYLYPDKNVLPMHCGANKGKDVALFFGLSGTGKTTLSSDPNRIIIGDDEHGWSSNGIFNFENGCYAKCINLSKEKEPQIWHAIKAGALVENVVLDQGKLDFNDNKYTENTRAAYPISYIKNVVSSGAADHPKSIIFLTADAFGVIPPISKLSVEQAMYHFISGYTSKLAGTERGIKDPVATFSTCFGAPFMIRPSKVYADMLAQRILKHKTDVFLLNTGWINGKFGIGERIPLKYTRTMLNAALDGKLKETKFHKILNLNYIAKCPGLPSGILEPEWNNKAEYIKQAKKLAKMFIDNFHNFPEAELLSNYGPTINI